MDRNEIKDFWDSVASDWEIQVGDEGDRNRQLNSDPVLWDFAGDVKGLTVLDAGCGTGYLSQQLLKKGAQVNGIDFSEKMIKIARKKHPNINFAIDSCSELGSQSSNYYDMIIANYVLMDTPDLEKTMTAFHRVLKPNGIAIVIFSHPCFPQGNASVMKKENGISYLWKNSYFEQQKRIDPPWGHFKSNFIWFHRPLSDYWKAFKNAAFDIVNFEEPIISIENYSTTIDNNELEKNKTHPYSVSFKLVKTESD
jgi:ubiquinone/menaquinone biosynthesis C-methylase UbiE